jgi:hypothetical protein
MVTPWPSLDESTGRIKSLMRQRDSLHPSSPEEVPFDAGITTFRGAARTSQARRQEADHARPNTDADG